MSAVKREQFVSDKMPYLVLRGGWCDVVSVHAPTDGKSYDSENSLCEELGRGFKHFPKYRVKFCQKISMQYCINLLKPTVHMMHQQFNIQQL